MNRSWSKDTRYLVLIIVLAGLIWLLLAARVPIGPLMIYALLAYVLNPAAAAMTSTRGSGAISHRTTPWSGCMTTWLDELLQSKCTDANS